MTQAVIDELGAPDRGRVKGPVAMKQADFIWMNGELVRWEDAKVHVLTHALHYGSGVFEGIRAYETERGTAVFRHQDHLDRLRRSAELYYMELPYTLEKLREATHELIRANKLRSCYIRPIAYRGYGEMGLFPLNAAGRRRYRGLAVGRLPRRGGPAARHPLQGRLLAAHVGRRASSRRRRPSGQYLNSILAKVETAKAGYDEAILLDEHGNVSEGIGRERVRGARRAASRRRPRAPRSSTASRPARSSRSPPTSASRSSSATSRAASCTRPTRSS